MSNRRQMWLGAIVIIAVVLIWGWLSIIYLQRQFGATPDPARFKTSDHFADGKFFNREAVELPVQKWAKDWTFFTFLFRNNHRPQPPFKTVALSAVDFSNPPGRDFQFYWLGHAFFIIEVANLRLAIDPVFANAAPVPGICRRYQANPLPDITAVPQLDYVLLTHDHYDHLEKSTIQKLKASSTCFITLLGVGARLRSWGIPPERIRELDWGEKVELPDLTIIAEEARHFSGRTLRDRFRTLWGSFILISQQKRIFWGGDGGYGCHFQRLGQQYGPFDLAALEIDAWNPRWPHHHMLPEHAVQAALELKSAQLLPIHWGVFDLAAHPARLSIERTVQAAEKRQLPLITPPMGKKFGLDGQETSRWWR